MENYNELLNNGVDNLEVGGNLVEVAEECMDLVPAELNADDIIKQTGKDALLTAGLIAGGLVVTYLNCKYVVPFAMRKVKEFKAKREQAKYEKELSSQQEK